MFCRNCGNKIPENAKFCPKCGAEVQGEQNASTNQNEEQNVKDTNVQSEKIDVKKEMKDFAVGTAGYYFDYKFKILFIGCILCALFFFTQHLIVPGIILLIWSVILSPAVVKKLFKNNRKAKVILFALVTLSVIIVAAIWNLDDTENTQSENGGSVVQKEAVKEEDDVAYFVEEVSGESFGTSVLFAYGIYDPDFNEVSVSILCSVYNLTGEALTFDPEVFELENEGVISTATSDLNNKKLASENDYATNITLNFTFPNSSNTDVTQMTFTADGEPIKLEMRPQVSGSEEAESIVGKYVSQDKRFVLLVYDNDSEKGDYFGITYLQNEDGTIFYNPEWSDSEMPYEGKAFSLNENNEFWTATRAEVFGETGDENNNEIYQFWQYIPENNVIIEKVLDVGYETSYFKELSTE